jgi:hypothetical protein
MAICGRCGAWTEPPALERDATGALTLICPRCRHRESFAQRPLWWVAGSPGSGKSTVVPLLRRELEGYVVFEGEAVDFWRFDAPPADYSSLYNQWLKIAWEIAQCDLPAVFVATATPDQLDACTYRSRFAPLHYLGLVCDEATQAARLHARPAWRAADSPEAVARACGFTRHLRDLARRGDRPIALADTTAERPEATAARIAAWVRATRADQ